MPLEYLIAWLVVSPPSPGNLVFSRKENFYKVHDILPMMQLFFKNSAQFIWQPVAHNLQVKR